MEARAWQLRAIRAWDSVRLARLCSRHPGLRIDPSASTNLAAARWDLAPGARVRIDAGVVTERLPGRLHFHVESGAEVEIGAGTWLRTEVGDIHLVVFEGARLRLGTEAFLNGCHLSAKREVTLGHRAWVGPGSRIFDSDQHDLDSEHPEKTDPVHVGDCVWISSDVTVLRGVTIGEHSVVGTRSLVTDDVPPHRVAYGAPARAHGEVGDRSRTR